MSRALNFFYFSSSSFFLFTKSMGVENIIDIRLNHRRPRKMEKKTESDFSLSFCHFIPPLVSSSWHPIRIDMNGLVMSSTALSTFSVHFVCSFIITCNFPQIGLPFSVDFRSNNNSLFSFHVRFCGHLNHVNLVDLMQQMITFSASARAVQSGDQHW